MSKFEKLQLKLLSGSADNNFSFDDLRNILLHFNFIERTTGGSHRIFYREGIEEIINIQPKGGKAKPYQVKQVRLIVLKYKLIGDGK
ncbi:MAG: type II toxin-antitoxin system HicA family toxin [Mucilaginibacter sp.]